MIELAIKQAQVVVPDVEALWEIFPALNVLYWPERLVRMCM